MCCCWRCTELCRSRFAGVHVRREVHPSELRTWTTLRHLENPWRTLTPFRLVLFSISGAGRNQCSGLKEITMSIKITTGQRRLAIHPWQPWTYGRAKTPVRLLAKSRGCAHTDKWGAWNLPKRSAGKKVWIALSCSLHGQQRNGENSHLTSVTAKRQRHKDRFVRDPLKGSVLHGKI